MRVRGVVLALAAAAAAGSAGCGYVWGCKRAEVTAVSLNPNDCWAQAQGRGCLHGPPEIGIPFYLPKPLLIVAKNFRNVEEAKVGLTDSAPIPNYLDDQAKYADVNARTSWTPVHTTASGQAPAATSGGQTFPTVKDGSPLATSSGPRVFAGGAPISPNAVPPDGLTPETFFTYQIVFVPDLTQKYALRIKGGAGELRAAMNMVNGWMFTGLGPFYMKDSSTAQNVLASGIASNLTLGGAADVITAVQNLRGAATGTGAGTGAREIVPNQIIEVHEKMVEQGFAPQTLTGFAEIYVYEPYLDPEGQMQWRPIVNHCFNRDFLGVVKPKVTRTTVMPPAKVEEVKDKDKDKQSGTGTGAGNVTPVGATVPTQVNVNCGPGGVCPTPYVTQHKGPLARLWDACKPKRALTQTTVADGELDPEQFNAVLGTRVANLASRPVPGAAVGPAAIPASPLPGGVLPVPIPHAK